MTVFTPYQRPEPLAGRCHLGPQGTRRRCHTCGESLTGRGSYDPMDDVEYFLCPRCQHTTGFAIRRWRW